MSVLVRVMLCLHRCVCVCGGGGGDGDRGTPGKHGG